MSSILSSRPIIEHTRSQCPSCITKLEYPTPTGSSTSHPAQVRCFQCNTVFTPVPLPPKSPPPTNTSGTYATGAGAGTPRKGRRIGTQEKPLETGYYDILGVPIDASTDDIKKAYRKLAIKLHPDKNRSDPNAEEKFKEIAIAYQTLGDPALRKKYNEFGPKESAPEGGYVDPEEVFSAMFGGEKFIPIIGNLSLAKDMKTALQDDEEDPEGANSGIPGQKKIMSPEEKAKKEEKNQKLQAQRSKEREERVSKLVENLERKLSIFSESATGPNDPDVTRSWKTICQIEAEDLKKESYGVELLQTIGFVYSSKAKHYLASNQTFLGVGGWLHGVQSKYHVFSETVSTVRAALEVKQVFEQLAEAEKGGLTPEQRQKLEEQATEKGIQALFKGTKLEIESVLRETCDRVLYPNPPLPRDKLILRATALDLLGEAFQSVKPDGQPSSLEEGYVKVESAKR